MTGVSERDSDSGDKGARGIIPTPLYDCGNDCRLSEIVTRYVLDSESEAQEYEGIILITQNDCVSDSVSEGVHEVAKIKAEVRPIPEMRANLSLSQGQSQQHQTFNICRATDRLVYVEFTINLNNYPPTFRKTRVWDK